MDMISLYNIKRRWGGSEEEEKKGESLEQDSCYHLNEARVCENGAWYHKYLQLKKSQLSTCQASREELSKGHCSLRGE